MWPFKKKNIVPIQLPILPNGVSYVYLTKSTEVKSNKDIHEKSTGNVRVGACTPLSHNKQRQYQFRTLELLLDRSCDLWTPFGVVSRYPPELWSHLANPADQYNPSAR